MHPPSPAAVPWRGPAFALAAILAVFAAVQVRLAHVEGPTADELAYMEAAAAVARHLEWGPVYTLKQGPLPLQANRLFQHEATPRVEDLPRARYGLILFAVLAAATLAVLAWTAFGPGAALVCTLLFCADSTLLGHGHLTTADVAMTAASLVTLLSLWLWLRRPGPTRLVWLGVALGASLATKYLTLLLVPVVLLAALTAVLLGLRPRLLTSRRREAGRAAALIDLLPATVVLGLVSLATLHACYLFLPGGYDVRATPPRSETLAELVDQAPWGSALSLLPDPFVRGIDFQLGWAEKPNATRLLGRVATSFPEYHLVALGVKLPVAVLVLLLGALAGGLSRWPPWLRLVWLLGVGVPLAALSLGASAQVGVRYLLPAFPLLYLAAGVVLHRVMASGRPGRVLGLVLLAGLLVEQARTWPGYLGDFNLLVGRHPHVVFKDANFDWDTSAGSRLDRHALEARHPDAIIVSERGGPRFGIALAHGLRLWTPDPLDAGRVHHWLRRFPVLDRQGGWLAFDTRPEAFAALVDPPGGPADARGLLELSIAHLGEGRLAEAQTALDRAVEVGGEPRAEDDPRHEPLVSQLARLADEDADPALVRGGWSALARYDRILNDPSTPKGELAEARFHIGDLAGARALLEELRSERPLWPREGMLLANVCWSLTDLTAALAALHDIEGQNMTPAMQATVARLRETWGRIVTDDAEMAAAAGTRPVDGEP